MLCVFKTRMATTTTPQTTMDLAFNQLASYESFYANTSPSAASEQKCTESAARVARARDLTTLCAVMEMKEYHIINVPIV